MVILATIQGNIGSGKSTIVNHLYNLYKNDKKYENVCFIQEPVDEWNSIKNIDGKTMIELFYSDQERYSFSFQMMSYISRLVILKNAIAKGYDIIISERSLDTDKNIFAKMLYHDGKICDVEYQIYMKWFNEFKKDFPEERVIYVKTSPEIASQRVKLRDRKGENIPIEYMQKCHQYHEDWIMNISDNSICLIDGNCDIKEDSSIINKWVEKINKFLDITC